MMSFTLLRGVTRKLDSAVHRSHVTRPLGGQGREGRSGFACMPMAIDRYGSDGTTSADSMRDTVAGCQRSPRRGFLSSTTRTSMMARRLSPSP